MIQLLYSVLAIIDELEARGIEDNEVYAKIWQTMMYGLASLRSNPNIKKEDCEYVQEEITAMMQYISDNDLRCDEELNEINFLHRMHAIMEHLYKNGVHDKSELRKLITANYTYITLLSNNPNVTPAIKYQTFAALMSLDPFLKKMEQDAGL